MSASAGAASGTNWRQQYINSNRADGAWIKVSRFRNNFRGVLHLNGAQLNLPLRPIPALTAADLDRVIYKAFGPDADHNGTLTPELQAQLDTLTLEEVIAQIKATGGHAFSRGGSAYRGVSRHKSTQKWRATFRTATGKQIGKICASEVEAACQYDAWCKQYGRPLSAYNFPPTVDGEADPAAATTTAAAAATTMPMSATSAGPSSTGAAAPSTATPPAMASITAAATAATVAAAEAPTPASAGATAATGLTAAAAAAGSTTVPAAAVPQLLPVASQSSPAAAAAVTSQPTSSNSRGPTAAAPAADSTDSAWEAWVEGDEGDWWTDSSDWEEEGTEDQDTLPAAPTPGFQTASAPAAAAASAGATEAAAAPEATQVGQQLLQPPSKAPSAAEPGLAGSGGLLAAAPAGSCGGGGGSSGPAAVSLHTTAALTAWQQLLGGQAMPPEAMQLLGLSADPTDPADTQQQHQQQHHSSNPSPADAAAAKQLYASSAGSSKPCGGVFSSGGSSAFPPSATTGLVPTISSISPMAAAAHHSSQQQQLASLKPAVAAAAAAAAARIASIFQGGPSGLSLTTTAAPNHQLEYACSGPGGASAAAAAAAGGDSAGSPPTALTVTCESFDQLQGNHLLLKAAVAKAAASITHHPFTISTAAAAVQAAGGVEPPADVVEDMAAALRTAAARELKQLQPGGSHYWRGRSAWKQQQQQRQAGAAHISNEASAEAAAQAAVGAADADAAATAAIAAAEAAGRPSRASDLHAAWLMQWLHAGVLQVTVERPVVPRVLLVQALADEGVDVLPGIHYEPVPGIHPELHYPSLAAATAAPSSSNPTARGPGNASSSIPSSSAKPQAAAATAATAAAAAAAAAGTNAPEPTAGAATPAGAAAAASPRMAADLPPVAAVPGAESAGRHPVGGGSSSSLTAPLHTPTAPLAATAEAAAAAGGSQPSQDHHNATAAATDRAAADAAEPMDWAAALAEAEEAAAAADYPFPLPSDRKPYCPHNSNDDFEQHEEEEDWEPEWMEGLLQGCSGPAAAAAAAGSTTPAALAAGIAARLGKVPQGMQQGAASTTGPWPRPPAMTAAAAAAAAAAGERRLAGKKRWGENLADNRRRRRGQQGFSFKDIPTLDVAFTGDQMADTIAFCKAVVAEGDADHLPSHIRSYRIAQLAKQAQPSFPLEQLLESMGRPIEGDYCPVVLGVPPPHPDAPAAAAAAAASAATAARPRSRQAKLADAFDPVNRRPPQALLLPGCSYSGQKAATRQATAAAVHAMADPIPGLTARGASKAALEEATDRMMATDYIAVTGAGPLVQLLRAADPAAVRKPGGAVTAAGMQAQQQQQEGEGQAGGGGAAASAGQQGPVLEPWELDELEIEERIAAVAAAAAAKAAAAAGGSNTQQQGAIMTPAALAAATSAPVVAAGIESIWGEADDAHLGCLESEVMTEAAEVATAAAAAVLQPTPLEVDWTHIEDLLGETRLWDQAEDQVKAAHASALRAAKARAAELAAEAAGTAAPTETDPPAAAAAGECLQDSSAGTGGPQQLGVAAGAAGRSTSEDVASSSRGVASLQQQQQPQILTGFIKADSCPTIDAARCAALGINMPRPLAIVHDYHPDTPAAAAAAAAVAALVPGGGRTHSSSVTHPTAGSAGDVTRVSYGAAQRAQRQTVAQLEARLKELKAEQALSDSMEAAFQAGGPQAAAAAHAAAQAAAPAQDPNAWMDGFTGLPPHMAYARAGGTKVWEEVLAELEQDDTACTDPQVVAAAELGMRVNDYAFQAAVRAAEETDVSMDEALGDGAHLDAALAAVLPESLPGRVRSNASLAALAVARKEAEMMGTVRADDDHFDLYYGAQGPASDEFWDSVLRGEVGTGQQDFRVAMPRVHNWADREVHARMTPKQRVYALEAEIRYIQERNIVREARRRKLMALTAPGADFYVIAQALCPVEGLNPYDIAARALIVMQSKGALVGRST